MNLSKIILTKDFDDKFVWSAGKYRLPLNVVDLHGNMDLNAYHFIKQMYDKIQHNADEIWDDEFIISKSKLHSLLDEVIVLQSEDYSTWQSNAYQPYFRLVGKRIPKSTALSFLSRYDTFFGDAADCLSRRHDVISKEYANELKYKLQQYGYRGDYNSKYIPVMYISDTEHKRNSYVHADGTVGLFGNMYAFPRHAELIENYMEWAVFCDEIDCVLLITKYDGVREYLAEYSDERACKLNPEDVVYGVRVTSGMIECLSPRQAVATYDKMLSEYTESEINNFSLKERLKCNKEECESTLIKLSHGFGLSDGLKQRLLQMI